MSLSSHLQSSPYIFPSTDDRTDLDKVVKNAICFYVTPEDHLIHLMSDVFTDSKKVYPLRSLSDHRFISELESIAENNKIILLVDARLTVTERVWKILTDKTSWRPAFIFQGIHGYRTYNVYRMIR